MPIHYTSGRFQAFDANGDPLSAGRLYTYAAGTLGAQATYTSASLATPNSNPVILDANGRAQVWLDPVLAYRMILKTSADVTITDDDNISSDSAATIIYSPAGTGSVDRTIKSKLDELAVSAVDFGAVGDGSTNDTAALDLWMAAGAGGRCYLPAGTYLTTTGVRVPNNTEVYGDGIDVSIIKLADAALWSVHGLTNTLNTGVAATNTGNTGIYVHDLTVDGNHPRAGSGSKGCAIQLAYVTDSRMERVKGTRGLLHCIDIANAEYTTTTAAGGESFNVTLMDCIGHDSYSDDAITIHHSGSITIINPQCTRSGDYALTTSNQHGLEIDDGSYDVTVLGGYAAGYYVGLQIKGHVSNVAAYRVQVDGFVAEGCTRNFFLTHSATLDSGTEYGVTLNNCTSIMPIEMPSLTSDPARALELDSYNSVRVTNFRMIGDPTKVADDDAGAMSIDTGASNIDIDGVVAIDVNRPSGVIHIQADAGENIRIRNVSAYDCYGPIVRNSLAAGGIVIEGIHGQTTLVASPKASVVELAQTAAAEPTTLIERVTANAGYSAGISDFPVTGTMSAVPAGMGQRYGHVSRWTRSNSSADVAGAVQLAHSVGVASGNQNVGLGESVGYGFKFRVQSGSVYTGAYIASYKNNSTDANTSTDLVLATRAEGDAGTGATIRWRLAYDGDLLPFADNVYDIGSGAYRAATIYAGTGTINTSDKRDKQQVRELNAKEIAVAVRLKGMMRAYKFKDAVAKKGEKARIHVGLMAQDVEDAFKAEGLDGFEYGVLCYDEWEGGSRYGLRYEELMSFIVAAM